MITESIEVRFKKAKTVKRFAAACSVGLFGFLLAQQPTWFTKSDNLSMIITLGFIMMVPAVIIALFTGLTLFNKKPALVLDTESITDHTLANTSRIILWKDITDIQIKQVAGQDFLVIQVKNPDQYMDAEKNPIVKRIMDLNMRLYKTPISINTTKLSIAVDELYKVMKEGLLS